MSDVSNRCEDYGYVFFFFKCLNVKQNKANKIFSLGFFSDWCRMSQK